jgi:hypothetical protein
VGIDDEATEWSGGAVRNYNGDVTIENSIFWGNVAADTDAQIHGPAAVSHSDVQGGCDSQSSTVCGEGNLNLDPEISSDSIHLLSDSPCIDSGENNVVSDAVDLDRQLRIVDGDADTTATVDMGADEFKP